MGTFPRRLRRATYDDPALGAWIHRRCGTAFPRYLGVEETTVLRSLVSWAWFRPAEDDWAAGAGWYRCDVVGGPEDATALRALPDDARGLLGGRRPDDAWLLCARGARFVGSAKVPCTEPHDWRAVSAVRVGSDDRAATPERVVRQRGRKTRIEAQPGRRYRYPGDRVVAAIARNNCSDWVGAWLDYPVEDYDFAVTVFHEAEWRSGNRRAICWGRTPR